MSFATLPKVELHLHLDCSLSYEVVKKLAPGLSPQAYRESFVAPAKCTNLADYISRAARAIELMQTEEQLRLVTLDLFEQLKADMVVYAEIRFAPLLHLDKGLNPAEVVQFVNDALTRGIRETGIEAGIILCTLRHFPENKSMETVRLVEQFKGTHVVGFDIAADEAGYPIDAHISAFQYAREKGISCTAHAGEARGAGSVWETLRHFYPKRIGHGVRSTEDPALMDFLKAKHIHLEICPTSNIQTNIYDEMADHPVDRIFRSGVSMSINTDGRSLSDVSLTDEYQTLHQQFDWQKAHFLRCNLHAIESAFARPEVKEKVRKRLLSGK